MVAGKNKIIGKLKNFKRYYTAMSIDTKINILDKMLDLTMKRINDHMKKQNHVSKHIIFSDDIASKVILKKLTLIDEKIMCNILGKGINSPDITNPIMYLKKHFRNIWGTFEYTISNSDIEESEKFLKDSKFGASGSILSQYYNIFKKISEKKYIQHIIICDFSKELFGGCDYHKNKNAEVYENIIKNSIPSYIESIDSVSTYFGLTVWFPYLGVDVLREIENFTMDQLFHDGVGEYPIRRIAKDINVPGEIKIEEKEVINLVC